MTFLASGASDTVAAFLIFAAGVTLGFVASAFLGASTVRELDHRIGLLRQALHLIGSGHQINPPDAARLTLHLDDRLAGQEGPTDALD